MEIKGEVAFDKKYVRTYQLISLLFTTTLSAELCPLAWLLLARGTFVAIEGLLEFGTIVVGFTGVSRSAHVSFSSMMVSINIQIQHRVSMQLHHWTEYSLL